MIKKYTFNYGMGDAEAEFEVDTKLFTAELAMATLDFFLWDYEVESDPIDEVMKKYALEAIRIATFNNYNLSGVIHEFINNEGFAKVDGSLGIKLISIAGYEFDQQNLDLSIKII